MLDVAKKEIEELLNTLAIIRAGELRVTEASKEEVDTFIYERAKCLFDKYENTSHIGLTLAMLEQVINNTGQSLRDGNSSDDALK